MIVYSLIGYLIVFHFVFPIVYLFYFSADHSIDPDDHIYYEPNEYTYENVLQRMLDIERVLKKDLSNDKKRLLFYYKNAVRTHRDFDEYAYLIEPGIETILLNDDKLYQTAWKDIDLPLKIYISIVTILWLPAPSLLACVFYFSHSGNLLFFFIFLLISLLFLILSSFLLVFIQLKIFSSYISVLQMIRKGSGKDLGRISKLHLNMKAIAHFFMATRFLGTNNSISISSGGYSMSFGGFSGGGFGGFGGGSSGGGGAGGSW